MTNRSTSGRPMFEWLPESRPCKGSCGRLIYPHGSRLPYRAARHAGQGMCPRCYRTQPRLPKRPPLPPRLRPGVPREVLLTEYEHLRPEGLPAREVARRVGMSFAAFERAVYRARVAGDPRVQGYTRRAA